MENIGVINPVTEPTDWVNALAFSRKPSGGLRVCLDPRSLNQCIKRTHYKTPTIEITNCLSGSKVFNKPDAKHGYWAIKLDEESSMFTAFNSPVGRFRFKRLPFGLKMRSSKPWTASSASVMVPSGSPMTSSFMARMKRTTTGTFII
ncbi:hypothetical protein V1264_017151 [Littorina saxatilis]|uniref:Reverse transcriptase domain-containing protein n=1 Tax=Littorina saxatilis TaxID=31220 RepID=A0AAN9BJ27_9CAEN